MLQAADSVTPLKKEVNVEHTSLEDSLPFLEFHASHFALPA